MMTIRRMAPMLVVALVIAPVQPLAAQDQVYQGGHKIHYAKTEVEKARGKCAVRLVGGALLGGLLGAAVGGKTGAAIGAGVGVGAGVALCNTLIANAKHEDKLIQAQLAAARSLDGNATARWTNDDGTDVTFLAHAGAARTVDGSKLIPVRYQGADGGKRAAPALETGGRDCRAVGGSFAGGTALNASQLVCRTPDGNYEPYEEIRA